MKARGFLIAFILALVVIYFLWFAKTGEKSHIEVATDRFEQTRVELTKTNMAQLDKAVQIFISSEGRTPKDLRELQSKGILVTEAVDGWGKAIKYEKISDSDFRLTSAGKDRKFGTDDDLVQDY